MKSDDASLIGTHVQIHEALANESAIDSNAMELGKRVHYIAAVDDFELIGRLSNILNVRKMFCQRIIHRAGECNPEDDAYLQQLNNQIKALLGL